MSRHEEMCPHCRGKAGLDETPSAVAPEPIRLPDLPTPIRVHHDGRTQDCTLHPDGTLTAVLGGELRRNSFTLAEMLERNWAGAHIEVDPAPIAEAEPEPTVEAVQEALIG